LIFDFSVTNPPDSAYGLWYFPSINCFVDDDGHLIKNIEDYFYSWEILEWLKTEDYGVMIGKDGELYELFWLEDYEDIFMVPELQNIMGRLV